MHADGEFGFDVVVEKGAVGGTAVDGGHDVSRGVGSDGDAIL